MGDHLAAVDRAYCEAIQDGDIGWKGSSLENQSKAFCEVVHAGRGENRVGPFVFF